MKPNRWALLLLFLLLIAVFQLPAQQGEGDRKRLADIRAKAEKGDAKAQGNLGLCYDNGEGVAKDAAEAVKWYRKAAEQGLTQAQFNLGNCYRQGRCAQRRHRSGEVVS